MRTGVPISRMKMSPPVASAAAWSTSCTLSWTLMKNRVMRASVTVTGPPAAIWRMNVGTTLPRLPRTLPKRTAQQTVSSGDSATRRIGRARATSIIELR